MSTEIETFEATTRTETGKGAVGRLRTAGQLPGVVYNSKGESTLVQLDAHQFKLLLARTTSESILLDLVVDGAAPLRVLLKETQYHPVNPVVRHVDFQAIEEGRKVKLAVALDFVGTPVGVANGGTLDYHVRALKVECLPENIVTELAVDVSHLDLTEHLLVKDVTIDREKYRILNASNVSWVSIAKPRVAAKKGESEDAPAAAAAGGEAEA